MGNKRKASLVIIVVILAALTVFSCVPFFVLNSKTNVSAADKNTNKDIFSYSASKTNEAKTIQMDLNSDATYAIIFSGQDGGGGDGKGKGATCLAFLKGDNGKYSNGNYYNWIIGTGGGSGEYLGGGRTNVWSNFALPTGSSEGDAYAAGGGGGYAAKGFTPTAAMTNAVFKNGNVSYDGTSGGSATQSSNGQSGKNAPSGINGASWNWLYWTTRYYQDSSGGGAGYKSGGGGGRVNITTNIFGNVKNKDAHNDLCTVSPGGGGSCSPNVYPIYAHDSTLGVQNSGTGSIYFYRIDPNDAAETTPTATAPTKSGEVATINAGKAGSYTMSTLSVNLSTYITTAWVYSMDGGETWETDATKIKNDEPGTTKEVICRYVIYATSETYTKESSGKFYPAYGMKYWTAASAANDSNYTIRETKLQLTCKDTCENGNAPVGKTGLSYTGGAQCLIQTAGTVGKGIGEMRYSLTENASDSAWSKDINSIKGTAAGTYKIYYKVFSTDSTRWITSAVKDIEVTIGKVSPGTLEENVTAPSLTYTGEAQALFTGNVKFKDVNGKYSSGIVYYTTTKTDTEPAAGDGTTDLSSLTATDAGKSSTDLSIQTYYLWARIAAGSDHSAVGWKKIATNKINKADPNLNRGTLAAKTGLVYNADNQSLFEGNIGYVTGAGTPHLGISTSATKKPTSTWNTGGHENGKRMYAVDENGNQYTYYLWGKIDESQNYNGKDWVLMKNGNNNITNTIARAKLESVTATMLPARNYNGQSSPILTNIKVTTNSQSVLGNFSLTFTEERSWVNGAKTDISTEIKAGNVVNDLKLFYELRAGNYSVSVKWAPKSDLTNLQKKQYIAGDKNFGLTTIHQINVNQSDLGFGGLTLNSDMTIQQDGNCHPYPNAQFDLIWGNYATDNGVSDNNETDDNGNEVNYFSYCFIHELDRESSLTENGIPKDDIFVRTTSAAEINNALKSGLDRQGNWDLYVRIDRHLNLKSEQVFKIDEFEILGYQFLHADFEGFTMNQSVIYDGKEHTIATGELRTKENVKVVLENVWYSISTSPSGPGTTWSQTIKGANEGVMPMNVGTYYLFAQWSRSKNALSNSIGMVLGEFEIKKCSINDFGAENLSFVGFNFGEWGAGVNAENSIIYSKIYENQEYSLGNISDLDQNGNPVAKIVNASYSSIQHKHFGNFFFAAGNANQPTTDYVEPDNFYNELKIKNVNPESNYYIWVRWDGSNNIEHGACIARVYDNETAVVPQFKITQKTDNTNVALPNEYFVASFNEVEYQWRWNASKLSADPYAQPLFSSTGTAIQININSALYEEDGVSYQYIIKPADITEVGLEDEWRNSIAESTFDKVGKYNLWVLVKIQNTNVNLTKIIKTSASATITQTESFVRIRPIANTDLKANNGEPLQLINPTRKQQNPILEYAIIPNEGSLPDDYENWIQDIKKVTAIGAGTYHIYYRGAADESFYAQTEPSVGYPYIEVYVDQEDSLYDPRPSAKPMKYTGQALKPFNQGYAKIGQGANAKTVPLLYSWNEGADKNWHTYEVLDGKVAVGTYLLYYKISEPGHDDVSFVRVEIEKADIQIQSNIVEKSFVYQGADYNPLRADDIDYAIVDGNGNVLNVNNVDYKYSYLINTNIAGSMGEILYGISTSSTAVPDKWHTSYASIAACAVGKYYIWAKVKAGDSHNGNEPVCCNVNAPFEITQVSYLNENGTANFNAEGTIYSAISNSYNGTNLALIYSVGLNFQVVKRDADGNIISGVFNTISQLAEAGTIYYALSTNNDVTDDNENWQRSYQVLSKVDAGVYYLKIKLVGDRSLGTAIFYLQGDLIEIHKAATSSIAVSGIEPLTQMYTGEAQTMATGELTVRISATRFNLADQVEVTYYYAKPGESVDEKSAWKTFDEVKATDVGKHYLWARLDFKTNNFTEKIVYMQLFNETNCAEITAVKSGYIQITAPTFLRNLAYQGFEQCLIAPGSTAGIKMTSGAEIKGQKGQAFYYISTSNEFNTSQSPINSINDVKGKDAGTYYIWVAFTAGVVHEAVDATCVGSVTIAKASDLNIALSGLNFGTSGYDGAEHKIVSGGGLVQILANGRDTYTLQFGTDYKAIKYAYSTSPDFVPDADNDSIWYDNCENLKVRDAGEYYVWVKVIGTENIANYVKCYTDAHFEIYKVSLFANGSKQELKNILFHEELVYIAQSQVLASIDGKLEIKVDGVKQDLITLNEDLEIYWALGNDDTNKPIVGWTAKLEDLQGVNSCDYYLWVWIKESKNIYERIVHLRTIRIMEGNIVFDEPIINEGLIYDGTSQELIAKPAVPKFYAEGEFYDAEQLYYEANGLVVEYSLNCTEWFTDITDIAGLNAGSYEVTYRVRESSNWAYKECNTTITITPADGTIVGLGLETAPAPVGNVYYNEGVQDLITFGTLTQAAIDQGCKIVFFYADDNLKQYEYYFDIETQQYIWGETGPLPGRQNVSTEAYHIQYIVIGGSNGNFSQTSEVKDIYVNINKRFVSWLVKPEPVYDFDYTDGLQPLLRQGELSVNSDTVYVVYTTEEPGTPNRTWSENIPTASTPNLRFVWYRVVIKDKNSIFVGSENNDPDGGTRLAVYFEREILTIEDLPMTKSDGLEYTAEEQLLIDFYFLSSDYVDKYGENAPFIEFKLKDSPYDVWTPNVSATVVGKYTVLYRVNYDDTIFRFVGENDGRETPMELDVEIRPVEFIENSIRAVFDEKTRKLSLEVTDKQVFNEETREWETVPQYSQTLIAELEQNNSITYYYRKNDENSRDVWQIWDEHNTANMTMGTYEFKVMIERPKNKEVNFLDYAQTGDFDTYTYTETRTVEIVMHDYSSVAYVRVWIDFDGNTGFESSGSTCEGWVNGGAIIFEFPETESAGNNTSIKIQIINDAYYYMDDTENTTLNDTNKKEIVLKSQDLKNKTRAFNQGLISPHIEIHLYEVYNIKYDTNGGQGEVAEGWKWHGIDYMLAENTFTKEGVSAGGWYILDLETSSQVNYSGSMYYSGNTSQTFYARYFRKGENSFVIQWVIKYNSKIYKLERDTLKWFNASLPENETRTVGVFVDEGDLITLPQIQTAEDGSLSTIFGGYISGWETETGNVEYQIGMKATGNMIFVAKLKFGDYVQCKFENGEGEEIHDSGLIADGAEAYMALSGMDADFIKTYKDGYDKWVQEYGTKPLDSSKTPDGILTYQFGTKSTPVEDEENTGNSPESATASLEDYLPMLIVIALGVVLAVIVLFGYFAYRNKMKSKNITE